MFTQTERPKPHTKMDSETEFSSDTDYDEFANEILSVGDILQPFQFEPSLKYKLKKTLAGTSASGSVRLLRQIT